MWDLKFEVVNEPCNIWETDIEEIYAIESDMWARNEWLWEYMICNNCSSIYSKQDIFKGIPKDIYSLTVSELEKKWHLSQSSCSQCFWELQHCFPKKEYLAHIRERYREKSLLVLMKKEEEIIWFMDWYFSDFETIFQRELSDHYESLWLETVIDSVKKQCGWILPETFFSCSSMGTRESSMNFLNIYALLQNFFLNFPQDSETCPGISEINVGWTLDKIYTSMWAQKLTFDPKLDIKNTSTHYSSWIFIQPKLWETYKSWFSLSARDFLKSLRKNK